jgi:DNA-binding beta-propeller fold protein YncE
MKAATLLLILTFVSCLGLFAHPNDTTLVWPNPPDPPHIRHLQTISEIGDLKQEKGFFSKLLSFFTGGESVPRWFVQPVGIAVSPVDGRIAITDPGAKCIHILDLTKKEYNFIAETKYGKFISPVGVAFTEDGQLYVSDSERNDIILFNRDLEAEEQLKDSLLRPTGLQIVHGKLYVIDTGQHRVLVFDLQGKFQFSFGKHGDGVGEFNYPVQIAAHDSLYIVDALNYRIQKFNLNGEFQSTFGQHGNIPGRFANPKAVALDSDGDVYVTDALMDNFQIFNSSEKLLLVVGKPGRNDGEFSSPGGIAIDHNNTIYIVETLNKRIQIFQYLK